MNDGHRHDTLDDFHGFWNICKVQKLGNTLMHQWAYAQLAIEELRPLFEEFSQLFSSDVLNEWEALYAKPLPDKSDKDMVDLFTVRVGKEIPSFRSRIDAQLAAENLRVLNQSGVDGVTLLLAEGISLDIIHQKLLHFSLQKNLSKSRMEQLGCARLKYNQQVATFAESVSSFFPLIILLIEADKKSSYVSNLKCNEVESSLLFLPSYFDSQKHVACQMQQVAQIEHDLREGQANDLLEEVQRRILTYNHISVVKKNAIEWCKSGYATLQP
uniref:Uncharacterized protein n=1 Tax=Moniliophthora roreri TaxID=221103 RepID=A0A0W0G7J1_MONRR